MNDIERIMEEYKEQYMDYMKDGGLFLSVKNFFTKAIEQYVIKARREVEGLVIKKFIMTLPMDIRRLIMAYHSAQLKGEL